MSSLLQCPGPGVASIQTPNLSSFGGADTYLIRLRKAYGATRLQRGMQRPSDFGVVDALSGRITLSTKNSLLAGHPISEGKKTDSSDCPEIYIRRVL